MDDAAVGPPEVVRLVGHPLRWRLLGELARCDRTVRELCGRVGEPQNLVSYHLGKLRRAQLVAGRRSSADGRDTYYRADLAQVTGGYPAFRATAGELDTRVGFLLAAIANRPPAA